MAHHLASVASQNSIDEGNIVFRCVANEMKLGVLAFQVRDKLADRPFFLCHWFIFPTLKVEQERVVVFLPKVPSRWRHRLVPPIAGSMKLAQDGAARGSALVQDNAHRLPFVGLEAFEIDDEVLFRHGR